MVLCVEGDVDPEKILSIASEELPPEKNSIPRADFGAPESLLPAAAKKSVSMEVSAPQFLIGAKVDPFADLRTKIVASIALKLLCGSSSSFYTRLYAEGLLTRDFDFETDYSAETGTVIIGGESPDPEKVYAEFVKELASVASDGFDSAYFDRCLKSAIGSRLRTLEDFEDVCVNTVFGRFEGFDYFDGYELIKGITKEDCESWLAENLPEERLAISLITPV